MFKQFPHLRYYSIKLLRNDVVIVGAVRTPLANYDNFKGVQLARLVIDEVVKRARTPREAVRNLIMCSSYKQTEFENFHDITLSAGLKQCINTSIIDDSLQLQAFIGAVDTLRKENTCIIFADVRQNMDGIIKQNMDQTSSEIMPVRIRLKGATPRQIAKDETLTATNKAIGAAALALTTDNHAKQLNLQPLCQLLDFEVAPTGQQAVNDLHNRHGLNETEFNVFYKGATSITHMLTHITHTLRYTNDLSVVVIECEKGGSIALMLKKCKFMNEDGDSTLPKLTLYTKDPCPLCDELVAALEANFPGEYQLEKVYIDRKENVRYLRLFRYDIPVLFFNGQFLCMHELNVNVLRHNLQLYKTQKRIT